MKLFAGKSQTSVASFQISLKNSDNVQKAAGGPCHLRKEQEQHHYKARMGMKVHKQDALHKIPLQDLMYVVQAELLGFQMELLFQAPELDMQG